MREHGLRGALTGSGGSAWRRRDLLLTAAGGGAVLIVLLFTLVIPFLDRQRRIVTETPQPAPLFATSLVELRPGQQACADLVGLLPGRQVAQVRVGTFGKPAVPLQMSFLGGGHHTAVAVAPTYVDNAFAEAPFSGPAKAVAGSVCVKNKGSHKVALYASEDRTKSRSKTTVAGKLWPSNFDLIFFAAKRQSLLDDAGSIVRRLRVFHAHIGVGVLWLLAFLVVLFVPLASIAAVALAGQAPAPPRRGAGGARGEETPPARQDA